MTELLLFELPVKKKAPQRNPLVQLHGLDPEGRTCQSCRWLDRRGYEGRYWYKCLERPDDGTKATDHKRRWPACTQFLEIES